MNVLDAVLSDDQIRRLAPSVFAEQAGPLNFAESVTLAVDGREAAEDATSLTESTRKARDDH